MRLAYVIIARVLRTETDSRCCSDPQVAQTMGLEAVVRYCNRARGLMDDVLEKKENLQQALMFIASGKRELRHAHATCHFGNDTDTKGMRHELCNVKDGLLTGFK